MIQCYQTSDRFWPSHQSPKRTIQVNIAENVVTIRQVPRPFHLTCHPDVDTQRENIPWQVCLIKAFSPYGLAARLSACSLLLQVDHARYSPQLRRPPLYWSALIGGKLPCYERVSGAWRIKKGRRTHVIAKYIMRECEENSPTIKST